MGRPLSDHEKQYRELQSRAVKYLAQFGYLSGPSRETGNLMSADDLSKAIKSLQQMAGLPETGVIDRRTEELMSRPRCGNVDSLMGVTPGRGRSDLGQDAGPATLRRRYRRYTEAPSKWDKKNLTFRLLNYTPDMDITKVRETIRDAFTLWSNATQLLFTEVMYGNADIMIQFASRYHQDGYPFDGKGMILAHAFFPGAGKGGDTHFDDDEHWTINSTDGVDLFMVAAHEFGHALGLAHSADPGALMYPWYQGFSGKFILPRDDTEGIQRLYGPPMGDREFPDRPTVSLIPRVDGSDATPRGRNDYDVNPTPGGDDERQPDPCTTSFDAITVIRNEVFLFIGKWFWRLDSRNIPLAAMHIHTFWYGLPKSVTKIDAVFERPGDKRIIFFAGDRYWVYNANQLITGFPSEGRPITEFGIPADVKHIDTVFTWGFNKRTYLVSGDMYWKLDENNTYVEYDYPRDMSIWRGVPVPLNAAFKYWDGKTYFFQGRLFWQFYDLRMRTHEDYPQITANHWLTMCSDDKQSNSLSQPAKHQEQFSQIKSSASTVHQALVMTASALTILILAVQLTL